MAKFEAHITCPREKSDDVKQFAGLTGWSFSAIDGDPVMGKQAYCYLTAYRPVAEELLAEMAKLSHLLLEANVPVLREKIERIIYDTKTGVDEIRA